MAMVENYRTEKLALVMILLAGAKHVAERVPTLTEALRGR